MKFFFDNCVSSNLTAAMRQLNDPVHEIVHLVDRFPPDALDVDWLPKLAPEADLVLISADPGIVSDRKEREIWRATGLTSFFLSRGYSEQPIWTQVIEVVTWWPEIVRTAKGATRGSGYLLPLRGYKKGPKSIYTPRAVVRHAG